MKINPCIRTPVIYIPATLKSAFDGTAFSMIIAHNLRMWAVFAVTNSDLYKIRLATAIKEPLQQEQHCKMLHS